MKVWRVLLLLVLLAGAATLLAYLNAEPYAERLIEREIRAFAESHSIELSKLELRSVSASKLDIETIAASFKNAGIVHELTLSPAAVSYSLQSLREHRVETIRVGTGEIKLMLKHSAKSSSQNQEEFHLSQLPIDTIEVGTVRGSIIELPGASFRASNPKVDLKRESIQASMKLKGFLLDDLLKLYPQTAVSGTGLLEGEVPFTWTREGIRIREGKFNASAEGGVIQIQSPPQDSALSQQVLELLRDFHYTTLSGTIEYAPDGRLLLSIALQGENPAWQNGQLVNLNLNIEENVPVLLKSLTVFQQVEEAVGGLVR